MVKKTSEELKKMCDEHWKFIEDILLHHSVNEDEIKRIGFYYKSALFHGYKHALTDLGEKGEYVIGLNST